ncbi:MAG: primosomal protein N', partial [Oscillospiraceae bacterium]|nr:primosomal protein N' [Oscillospiraceae bacterium]
MIAKIAVSGLPYSIDRLYDYKVPEAIAGRVRVGVRVIIPFGRGDKQSEGIVLEIAERSEYARLKSIAEPLDEEPVLSAEGVQLVKFVRARFYCTYYDAVRAMLPTGLWFKGSVGRYEQRARGKTVKIAVLAIRSEEAIAYRSRSEQQLAVLRFLAESGEASVEELCYYTGVRPAVVNALGERGAVRFEQREVLRRPKVSELAAPMVTELSGGQRKAYEELEPLLCSGSPEAALLYGVTGSGKTSVYIKLIAEAIRRGRGAIVLVPEIALTPQLTALFTLHFGEGVAVLHSSLTIGERYDEWRRLRSGEARVAVGTRSAIFAPVHELGIVIVDEEQEQSYQSENAPRYNAVEVAKYRCVQSKAMLLLGSATPSVESMYAAKTGRYKLAVMSARFNTRPLPEVMVADMRRELKDGYGGSISRMLQGEIRRNLEQGEQTILFINRRGAHSVVACPECGTTFACPDCSVSLTYHSANGRLMCHYCGYSQLLPNRCPTCGGILKFIGTGIQKVEDEFRELFPGVAMIRMDADTVNAANSHEAILKRFSEER